MYYDPRREESKSVKLENQNIEFNFSSNWMHISRRELLVCGGYYNSSFSKMSLTIDVLRQETQPQNDMTTVRLWHGIAKIGGSVYAMLGRKNSDSTEKSIDRFDIA